jgi:hypothetical protein
MKYKTNIYVLPEFVAYISRVNKHLFNFRNGGASDTFHSVILARLMFCIHNNSG